MTIADEINRITGNIDNAYSALADKGATMPVSNNSALLADTINTISTGGGGYQEIGVYMIDANGVAQKQAGDIDGRFKGITQIADYAMQRAFYDIKLSGDVNFCNCIKVGGSSLQNAFYNTGTFTGFNFSKCTNVGYYGFDNAFNRTSFVNGIDINFSNLVNVQSFAFSNSFGNSIQNYATANFCNLTFAPSSSFYRAFTGSLGLKSVDFSNLVNTSNGSNSSTMTYAFAGTGLTSVSFPSLEKIGFRSLQSCFVNCQSMTSAMFEKVNTISSEGMTDCFRNCPNLTTITIGNTATVQNGLCISNINMESTTSGSMFYNAFQNTGIKTIDIDLSFLTSSRPQGGGLFYNGFKGCKKLTDANITIPYLYGSDFQYAFQNCPNMANVSIMVYNGTNKGYQTYIECFDNAFYNCPNLSNVSIGFGESGVFLDAGTFTNMFRGTGASNLYIQFNGLGGYNATANSFANFLNGTNNATVNFTMLPMSNDIFGGMLSGTNNCTVIFNGSDQATVEGFTSYASNFGGSNATISFV